MSQVIAAFIITLGVGQLISSLRNWRAASLVGPSRQLGVGIGILLVLLGIVLAWLANDLWASGRLPYSFLLWALPISLLTLIGLLTVGTIINPPEHPDALFDAQHPCHNGCQQIAILDGDTAIPGYLLNPLPNKDIHAGVCIFHGSGDNKSNFKWRLILALLNEGLTVLSVDLPGHGDYQHRPLAYPDCLSVVAITVSHIQSLPNIDRVGVLGISLGGAIALNALALDDAPDIDALIIMASPLEVIVTRKLVLTELWQTMRAPVLSLLQEMSVRQLWHSWQQGAIHSQISTSELFRRLDPLTNIDHLSKSLPILLVYSQNDPIAQLSFGQALQTAAPQADLLIIKKASHVTLTLMPSVNQAVSIWLKKRLM